MSGFTVYDPRSGKILRSGDCQEHMIDKQAGPSEAVLPIQTNPESQAIDLATLLPVEISPAEIQIDYRLRRFHEYPSIGDQLDVLWKAFAGMPLTQEAEAMRAQILAVKERHPKP